MLLAVLAAIALVHHWHRRAQKAAQTVTTELRQLQTQWATASKDLDRARQASERFQKFSDQAARVTKECGQLNWSCALQGIVASSGANIRLRDVRVRRISDDPEVWSLRVAGLVSGVSSRSGADTFRRQIQGELEKAFNGSVSTQFEGIEELPNAGANGTGAATATFTIVATIGPAARSKQGVERGS